MRRATIGVTAIAMAAIGATGLSLIKQSEGLRLNAYLDVVGIPTVCYGHTGPEVRLGISRSLAECEAILLRDIEVHQVVIRPRHPRNCIGHVPLTSNQRDAITSFTFNVGTGRFCGSTMARLLRAGRMLDAADELPKWNKARSRTRGLVVLSGLTRRRTAERRLFLTIDRPEPASVPSGQLRPILAP